MAGDQIPHYTAPPNEFADAPNKPMTPLERAAEAVRDEIGAYRSGDMWMTEGGRRSDADFRDIARAVLTAIREPSEEMVEAARAGDDPGSSIFGDPFVSLPHGEAWQAMIDALLAEEG